MEVPAEERASSVALRRLLKITLTLFLTATLTYLVPSFERVRPWVRGEGVPVVRLFVAEKPIELPDFQGATASAAAASADELADLPINMPEPPPEPEPEPPPATTPLPSAQNGVAVAPPSQPAPPVRRARVAPKEYGGTKAAIENVEALSGFYAALARSAQGTAGAITRIAHYGDSSVAADEISRTARRKLQSRFGDSGHGFMLTARGNMFYGHRDIVHRESSGWDLLTVVRRQLRSGYYGYGGVVATGKTGDYTSYGTVETGPIGRSVSRFEVFYQRYAAGGELRLTVDDQPPQTVSTKSDLPTDAWEVIKVPDGPHSLTVHVQGEARVYGVSQERDVPGVVYDALGMVGARADRLLDADPKHMAAQIAHRDPDLLVLGFGGNEAGNDFLDMARYERDLIKVVKLMRSGKPSMSCLLFGPLDQGGRNDRGDIVTLRALPGIVAVQRKVALAEGCGFFDTYDAMGGEGSVSRWYRAQPRLFSPDFRHATPAGYSLIGEVYYQALLRGFAERSE